jgi:hypothetical protein
LNQSSRDLEAMTTSNTTSNTNGSTPPRRKLRALVITLPNSSRQEHIRAMFASVATDFEPPVFSEGIPQRSLRNRLECLRICHQAGLVPDVEWQAIQAAMADRDAGEAERRDPKRFLNHCLAHVPVNTQGRRGSKADLKVHYSTELWRKAKTINRGRAVLACTLAHLIALRKWYDNDNANNDNDNDYDNDKFDMILEDNVRLAIPHGGGGCGGAEAIWQAQQATLDWEQQEGQTCHLRFLGWLGSIPNLQWILQRHAAHCAFPQPAHPQTILPFPTTQQIVADLKQHGWDNNNNNMQHDGNPHGDGNDNNNNNQKQPKDEDETKIAKAHTLPGGTPVWGSYAYWMSREGYQALLSRLQTDVGSLLWKSKRGRYYHVKPADKVLPRVLMDHFGMTSGAVQLARVPAFFRAPMLTSKIHVRFDPEFCKSTEYQLQQCNLQWSDLWLTEEEQEVIRHRQAHGEWITLGQLRGEQQQEESPQEENHSFKKCI